MTSNSIVNPAIRVRWVAWIGLAAISSLALSVSAHHSFSGEFDSTKKAQLVGTVSAVDWINPHTYIHIDVKDEQGSVATWRLESLPTAMMRKAGLTKEMIMGDGSPVTADVILARDGTQHLAWVTKLTYADGHYYQLAASQ
jgi:Family of unknown function (DUF6152)